MSEDSIIKDSDFPVTKSRLIEDLHSGGLRSGEKNYSTFIFKFTWLGMRWPDYTNSSIYGYSNRKREYCYASSQRRLH